MTRNVTVQPQSDHGEMLLVLDMGVATPTDDYDLEIRLPRAWARQHEPRVTWQKTPAGWQVGVFGEDGSALLTPWTWDVEEMADRTPDWVPTGTVEEPFGISAQGYEASVVEADGWTYLWQFYGDTLDLSSGPSALQEGGAVRFESVLATVSWARVPTMAYQSEWPAALAQARELSSRSN